MNACIKCGHDVVYGFKLCQAHLDKQHTPVISEQARLNQEARSLKAQIRQARKLESLRRRNARLHATLEMLKTGRTGNPDSE